MQKEARVPAERLLDRAEAQETYMTQHSESQSGFLHNFKRMFAPAPAPRWHPHPEQTRGNR